MIAGGERVSQQNEVIFPRIAGLARQLQTVGIGKGDAEKLGLSSLIAALVWVAIRRPRLSGIGGETGRRMALRAQGAETAADVSWNSNAVTLLHVLDPRADFLHHANRLLADDISFEPAHPVLVKVQIGATEGRRREPKQNISRLAHRRVRNFTDHDPPCLFKNHGFHDKFRFEQAADTQPDSDLSCVGRDQSTLCALFIYAGP
jgi:hypothetical protein